MTRERGFSTEGTRAAAFREKTAEPDIGSYDTCARPGSGREFLKMRQWSGVADEVR
jgi:hypothetical protein